MVKKSLMVVLAGLVVVNLCGCMMIMGMMADTAHAKQTIDLAYGDALEVVKITLKTEGINFSRADVRKNITEVVGVNADDRTVRILVTRVSDTQSMISVRAGTTFAGKKDAEKILAAIIEASSAKTPDENSQ